MLGFTPLFTAYILFITALAGLVMGSFLNCWAWRLANGERISRGRSHCPSCGHVLGARDLVPLLSWLVSRGRCRYCGAPVSVRYPATEALTALFFMSVVLRWDVTAQTLRWLAVGSLLLVAALVDLDTFEIPDRLLVGMILVFAVYAPLTGGWTTVVRGLLGAVGVAGPLLVVVLAADRVLGCETMGGGDIKLLAVLGLHFGFAQTLLLLICACFIGLAFAAVCRSRARKNDSGRMAIPFGPSLALAAWAVMLAGQPVVDWYLGLLL